MMMGLTFFRCGGNCASKGAWSRAYRVTSGAASQGHVFPADVGVTKVRREIAGIRALTALKFGAFGYYGTIGCAEDSPVSAEATGILYVGSRTNGVSSAERFGGVESGEVAIAMPVLLCGDEVVSQKRAGCADPQQLVGRVDFEQLGGALAANRKWGLMTSNRLGGALTANSR